MSSVLLWGNPAIVLERVPALRRRYPIKWNGLGLATYAVPKADSRQRLFYPYLPADQAIQRHMSEMGLLIPVVDNAASTRTSR